MSVITYKCPNCGGELSFQPEGQKYECAYCGSSFTQQQLEEMTPAHGQESVDTGYQSGDASGSEGTAGAAGASQTASQTGSQTASQTGDASEGSSEEAVIYSCPSCGAQIVTDKTTAATFCYYCHNPVVLEGRLSGEYLPDKVIPFKVSREKATEKFSEFVKRKKFVPKAFYNESQIEKLTGVYYPYWIYDADVDSSLSGEGTNIRVWRTGDIEFTKTSIFEVRRAGNVLVKNMIRNALEKTNRELVERVQPFNPKELKDFHMGYLSGFMAERRDMEKDSFSRELAAEAAEYAQRMIRSTAGYTSLKVNSSSFVPEREKWSYALLPVWVLTYNSMGQIYYFALNGQNGAVAGKLPIDWGKLILVSLLVGLAVAAAFLIGGYLL